MKMKKLILLFAILLGSVGGVTATTFTIKGSFDSWGDGISMNESSGVYSCSTTSSSGFEFKILKTGGESEKWLGFNELILDAPYQLVKAVDSDGSNFSLINTDSQEHTYNFTITSVGDKYKLTVTQTGQTIYEKTINFINGLNWSSFYIHTFEHGDTDVADYNWPGVKMLAASCGTTTIGGTSYDVYSYTLKSTTAFTENHKVIFTLDNSGSNQSQTRPFLGDKQYTVTVQKVFAVGTEGLFDADWDQDGTTDVMDWSDGDKTFSLTKSNVRLTAKTYSLKVINRSENHWKDPEWKGTGTGSGTDVTFTIDEDGYYDVNILWKTTWTDNAVETSNSFLAISPTINSDGYATLSSSHPLDFSAATGVKGYKAASATIGRIQMAKLSSSVTASTGIFLQKDGETPVRIPIADSGTDISASNLLFAGTASGVAASSDGSYNYVFAKQNGVLGFYKVVDGDLASKDMTGKAYLHTTTDILPTGGGARNIVIEFDDNTASITIPSSDEKLLSDGFVYDLQGRRVAQPAKGLYIVNGRKMVIK